MGFSISSPDLEQFQRCLERNDPAKVLWRAASTVSLERIVDDLSDAARAAGASQDLISDIGVYLDNGRVVVGVPGGPTGKEARNLEYGTAVGAPRGWLRATFAQHQQEYNAAFGDALTAEMLRGEA